LGVVAEGPTHGFAVARLLAADGALGRVWTVRRPLIYQALQKLLQLGLVSNRSTQRSDRGPVRTIVAISPAGRQAMQRWLAQPVDHVRDVRSLLLLKLALLYRSGGDTRSLLIAQRRQLLPRIESLGRLRDEATGFDGVLAEWRLASSRATLEFLDAIVTPAPTA